MKQIRIKEIGDTFLEVTVYEGRRRTERKVFAGSTTSNLAKALAVAHEVIATEFDGFAGAGAPLAVPDSGDNTTLPAEGATPAPSPPAPRGSLL